MTIERLEAPSATSDPVFVDATGRRGRRAAMAGRGVGAVLAGYLVLLAAGMARAPWVPPLGLPGLGPLVPENRSALPPVLPHAVLSPAPLLKAGPGPVRSGSASASPPGGSTPIAGGSGAGPGAGATGTPTRTPAGSTTTPGPGPSTTQPGGSTPIAGGSGAGPGAGATGTPTQTSAPSTTTPRPGRSTAPGLQTTTAPPSPSTTIKRGQGQGHPANPHRP